MTSAGNYFDIRQSEGYCQYMQSLGWKVEEAGAKVFVRHFPIFKHWSVIKIQRPERVDFLKLEEIARRHQALFIKLEPGCNFQFPISNFQKDSWPLLPSKTLVLDINKPLGEFFAQLPKDTRYEIKQGMKKRVRVEISQNIELFYKLLQQTMKIGHWEVPIKKEVKALWQSFQTENSQILMAYCDSRAVAGCLLIWEGETAHYMYAALTGEGRRLSAAYLLLFEAITFLKKKKITYLDLEGIYDERYPKITKNWKGFTKFKLGWGGKVVEYPGSYTKYFNPLVRLLFKMV